MSQTFTSDVVVKNAIKAVNVPLEDGLCSVNKVYKGLIEAQVDPITGQCSNYQYIREQIVQAKQKLEQSEQAAGSGLKSLDQNLESLTQEEGKLEKDKNDTQLTLDNFRQEQTSNKNLLKQSEDALQQARNILNSTRETLRQQEERKRNAEIVTGVGGGLFLIPFFGWIAGSVMVATGAVELDQAIHAVHSAEEELRKFESQVETYRSKVSEYEGKISNTEQNIKQKSDQVNQIQNDIQKVKEQREAVGDLQLKVRKVVQILGVLSGKASVAEGQTQKFILQQVVMKVMEDLMKAAGEIQTNQLLSAEGIPKLINEMSENNRKLAAICAAYQ